MPNPAIAGIPAALRQLLAAALDIGRVRLQLASNELEEARLRLVELFVYSLLASLFFVLGLVLAAILIAVVFWDSHRELALLIESLVFLAAALGLGLRARHRASATPVILETTLNELRRDVAALRAVAPSPAPPAPPAQ